MFLPDVFSYFIPYSSLFINPLIVTNEQLNPSIIDVISSNVGLLAGFITSVVVIGGIMITIGVWLKKTVTKENRAQASENERKLEEVKKATQYEVKENRSHIDSVKVVLEHKIDNVSSTMTSVKNTIEKFDSKLDKNVQTLLVTKTRMDNHEDKIDKIENRMYGIDGYDENLRRHKRKNDIDARYSLEATEDEVDEENIKERSDEKSRLKEKYKREEDDSHK